MHDFLEKEITRCLPEASHSAVFHMLRSVKINYLFLITSFGLLLNCTGSMVRRPGLSFATSPQSEECHAPV